jgi:hypothetical protein
MIALARTVRCSLLNILAQTSAELIYTRWFSLKTKPKSDEPMQDL